MIVTNPDAIVAQGPDGEAVVILAAPVECAGCHRMAAIVVNRDGKTRCVFCDSKRERQRAKGPQR